MLPAFRLCGVVAAITILTPLPLEIADSLIGLVSSKVSASLPDLILPIKFIAGIGIVLLGWSVPGSARSWEQLASLPEPNAGFAYGRVEGRIIVMGGTNWADGKKNWLRTVHAFDPGNLQWSSLPPLDQSLAYPIAGETPRGIIAAGGTSGEAPFTDAILVEGFPAVVRSKPGIATPSVLSAGGLVGEKLIFVGGTDSAGNVAGFHRKAFAWDIRTGEQHLLPPYPGPASGIGSAVVVGDELLFFGGCRFDAQSGKVVNLNEAYAFSVGRNEWRVLKPMPHAVRALTPVRLDGRYIYLGGGCKNEPEGFTNEAFVYDLVEDRYTPARPLPYRAALVGLILDGDYVYCIAGEDKSQHRSDAVYRIKRTELLERFK